MGTLAVTRSLSSNTNPTEAQLDTMRTDLLNFFNAASMNQDNIATGGMLYTSLANPTNNQVIQWTSSHATISYVSATDKFELKNTQGDVLFAHRTGSTVTEFLSVRFSDGAIEVFGELSFNTSLGLQTQQLMWLLSRYRKPRLVYQDNDIFTVEENSTVSGESWIMMRDRLCKIVDRTCSLAVTANGVGADAGAAVSGLAATLIRTADRWYYIYAVRVQSGTDANGSNAILIAHTTSPEVANIAALNTAFGTGEWVYMGLIRNGWNIVASTNIIVPFIYDEAGYMRFTQTLTTNEPIGVQLAQNNTTSNLEYDLAFGNAAVNTIPPVATRVIFGGYRESHGFELHYRAIASLENHTIITGCYHVESLSTLKPVIYMEVPALSGYRVVVVMGNVQTQKRITLAGLVDHYL